MLCFRAPQDGQTPLHYAAKYGCVAAAEALLRRNARRDAEDEVRRPRPPNLAPPAPSPPCAGRLTARGAQGQEIPAPSSLSPLSLPFAPQSGLTPIEVILSVWASASLSAEVREGLRQVREELRRLLTHGPQWDAPSVCCSREWSEEASEEEEDEGEEAGSDGTADVLAAAADAGAEGASAAAAASDGDAASGGAAAAAAAAAAYRAKGKAKLVEVAEEAPGGVSRLDARALQRRLEGLNRGRGGGGGSTDNGSDAAPAARPHGGVDGAAPAAGPAGPLPPPPTGAQLPPPQLFAALSRHVDARLAAGLPVSAEEALIEADLSTVGGMRGPPPQGLLRSAHAALCLLLSARGRVAPAVGDAVVVRVSEPPLGACGSRAALHERWRRGVVARCPATQSAAEPGAPSSDFWEARLLDESSEPDGVGADGALLPLQRVRAECDAASAAVGGSGARRHASSGSGQRIVRLEPGGWWYIASAPAAAAPATVAPTLPQQPQHPQADGAGNAATAEQCEEDQGAPAAGGDDFGEGEATGSHTPEPSARAASSGGGVEAAGAGRREAPKAVAGGGLVARAAPQAASPAGPQPQQQPQQPQPQQPPQQADAGAGAGVGAGGGGNGAGGSGVATRKRRRMDPEEAARLELERKRRAVVEQVQHRFSEMRSRANAVEPGRTKARCWQGHWAEAPD